LPYCVVNFIETLFNLLAYYIAADYWTMRVASRLYKKRKDFANNTKQTTLNTSTNLGGANLAKDRTQV